MDRFLRFIAGVALAVAYAVLALFVANIVGSARSDLWAVCLAAVLLGWIAISVVAFRKDQPWIGYGVIAAPFIALLIVTISCFALLNTQAVAPGSITGISPLP
jgi:hypothetical protein